MLNSYQKMVIQRAVGQAADKDAEIKNLAANMKVPEQDVRAVAERQEALKNACKDSQEPPKEPAAEGSGKPRKRVDWTPDMLRQLSELLSQGKGPTEIAKAMGLDVKRVQNKIQRIPESKAAPKTPAVPPAPPEPDKPANDQTPPNPATPVLPAPDPESDKPGDEVENRDYPIDMPGSLLLLMKLIHDNYGDNVIRVHASNGEHCAACAFEVDGTSYDLRLEVAK